MQFAPPRYLWPTVEPGTAVSRASEQRPAVAPETARGSNTATIRAARGLASDSGAGTRTAPNSKLDPRTSLVVVRGGLAGVFPRAASAANAFDAEIATLMGGSNSGSRHGERESVDAELSGAERRVLRYLPTNLTGREIADELFVSVNTVKTHMRHIYAKFDAHTRREAVDRARVLGLLATRKHNDVAQGTNRSLGGSIPQRIERGGMP
jgi:DNA-binding CsgD family transcriptional regulator